MSRLGIVGDPHMPWVHPMYLRFCQDTFQAYRVNKVHFVGDIVDNHCLSFHETDPNGDGASREAKRARLEIARWTKAFPKATVCIGNHDEMHYRKARHAGISDNFLKPYKTVWKTPGWDWQFEHEIDGVLYEHGTGNSGKDAAINLAINKRTSIVIGHIHSWAGVKWHANYKDRIFGMNVGCGIWAKAYVFNYGRTFAVRPMLGCGIVLDGEQAIFVPMPCGRGEKYHHSKAGKKR